MTKLIWGSPGEHYFEMGVDRGVLYVDGAGVAWNGLSSVSEKSPGGEIQPFYLDGIKYAQLLSAEDFEATIDAYSAPREFAICDGSYEIYNGLYATQQRRKMFDFSYRSNLGNDISGTSLGYKLHLVYNANAEPSDKTHSSVSASPDPNRMSWTVSTIPNQVSGIRPTAHFVVDSTRANPADLTTLEDLLYGTNITEPSFPTASELLAIFA